MSRAPVPEIPVPSGHSSDDLVLVASLAAGDGKGGLEAVDTKQLVAENDARGGTVYVREEPVVTRKVRVLG